MKRLFALMLVVCMVLPMAAMAENAAPTYTYRTAATTFPTNWSPLQQKTATDSDLLSWLQCVMYTFDFNEDLDGYVMKPLAAADFPVDVTADYVGTEWNIKEGDTARAWKIALRDNLAWEDGTPIKAQDFVRSAELTLDPKAQNYRADMFYSGNMVVANAEAFLKQGLASSTSFGVIKGAEELDADAFFAKYGEEKGYINWANSFGDTYDFEAQKWTGEAANSIVETPLTVAELYKFYTEGAGAAYATWATPEQLVAWTDDELFMNYVQYPDAITFDKVGIQAVSDNELVLILTKPLEGFYLLYSLDTAWLVNEELYNACASEKDGVYTNTYGTSKETSMSWGPYKLTSFQSDKVYELERNDNWFGYSLPEFEGHYQTDKVVVNYVADASTRMEMFLNGQLDVVGLDKDHVKEYATSDFTYYDEGDSVFAMVFNPNLEALKTNQAAAGEHINKTILTIKEFRMAMSMAMNRQEFCLATSPTNAPAFALYGGQIVSDPEKGEFYRTTDVAKKTLVDFWGLADEVGEGKLYANMDDAIDSISGYNLNMAKLYFDKAYDLAVEKGLMTADDTVEIMVGTPNATSAFYNSGYDFIVNNYTEAVKGTKLEGKLTFKRDATLGNGFGDALRNNQVDMLFGVGWTGSTFDPFSLIEAYVAEAYQYDPAWKPADTQLTINLNGVDYTTDVYTWYQSINNEPVSVTNAAGETVKLEVSANADDRVLVLGALENAILQNYDFIPLMGDSSAKLKGMKIQYFVEDEVFPLGRGGVEYMTYNYDDAAWEAFVASQGGTLNYK